MKKSELIKLLLEIRGNPEILLWNGYTGDFMKISGIQESDLVKMTKEDYIERIRLERCVDLKDWEFQFSTEELSELEDLYKKVVEWEHNEYVTQEDVKEGRYSKKRVFYITPKKRGKTSGIMLVV